MIDLIKKSCILILKTHTDDNLRQDFTLAAQITINNFTVAIPDYGVSQKQSVQYLKLKQTKRKKWTKSLWYQDGSYSVQCELRAGTGT